MKNLSRIRTRILYALTALLGLTALTGCASIVSPLDQAYYTAGDNFNFAGGYTRTIFSTSNF